jgi:hypothetical protein
VGRINWGRVLGGGLVAGLVGNGLEALHGFLMKAQYEQMMKSIHKDMAEPKALVAHLVWSFILGIASIWLYAAIRPRYGPGPATAMRAAFAVWIFAHATFAIGTVTLGIFPARFMAIVAAVALVERIVSTLTGSAIYRESPSA